MPVRAGVEDRAGNPSWSAPATAYVDNTPPAKVRLGLEGGEGWRRSNGFAVAWENLAEGRPTAPIAGAAYSLCRPDGGGCQADADVSGDERLAGRRHRRARRGRMGAAAVAARLGRQRRSQSRVRAGAPALRPRGAAARDPAAVARRPDRHHRLGVGPALGHRRRWHRDLARRERHVAGPEHPAGRRAPAGAPRRLHVPRGPVRAPGRRRRSRRQHRAQRPARRRYAGHRRPAAADRVAPAGGLRAQAWARRPPSAASGAGGEPGSRAVCARRTAR